MRPSQLQDQELLQAVENLPAREYDEHEFIRFDGGMEKGGGSYPPPCDLDGGGEGPGEGGRAALEGER